MNKNQGFGSLYKIPLLAYDRHMIAQLRGQLITRTDKYLVLDVNGVGYKVYITGDDLALSTEKNLTLFTHLAVRENALDLYGFSQMESLEMFELLLNVSGVGPKTALGILSVAAVPSLRKAIATGEIGHLTKVSGLGAKIANKIVLELKGKVKAGDHSNDVGMKEEIDSMLALQALGYSERESREALSAVDKKITATNARIKEAIKLLGQK